MPQKLEQLLLNRDKRVNPEAVCTTDADCQRWDTEQDIKAAKEHSDKFRSPKDTNLPYKGSEAERRDISRRNNHKINDRPGPEPGELNFSMKRPIA